MQLLLNIALSVWASWCAFNVAAMVCVAIFVKPSQPCFNGFHICMPAWLDQVLTPAEIAAVLEHERGHRHNLHVWVNLALRCMLLVVGAARRRAQEIEADDYAATRGHGLALAAALRKLSSHPDDLSRAERLLRM